MVRLIFYQDAPAKIWDQAHAVIDVYDGGLPAAAAHLEATLGEIAMFTTVSKSM